MRVLAACDQRNRRSSQNLARRSCSIGHAQLRSGAIEPRRTGIERHAASGLIWVEQFSTAQNTVATCVAALQRFVINSVQ